MSCILTSKTTTVKRTPALNTEKVKSTKNKKVKRRERNAKKKKTAAQTQSLTKRFKKGATKFFVLKKKNNNNVCINHLELTIHCVLEVRFTKCENLKFVSIVYWVKVFILNF